MIKYQVVAAVELLKLLYAWRSDEPEGEPTSGFLYYDIYHNY